MIDPAANIGPVNSATTASVSQATLSADYEAFLQLLTAQVANQDPLEPMDASTFVSQLAQLSQVEQSIISNSHLEQISGQIAAGTSLSDVGLIGRTVMTSSSEFNLGPSGGVDLSYRLEEGASSVSATILSDQGVPLRTFEGLQTSSGQTHELYWDGRDFYGLPLTEGSYRIKIDAVNSVGDTVSYETFVEAEVESVVFADGFSQLQLANGETILAQSVEAVK
ncbi:Basal-body rod modification protein FlgD [Roseivivax sp. THAF40]|uniref:flagellar hook assembly protein FlgD n=1 Tax=Roseivivax sp. THAF40 TaxID=2587858 RepID=UPI001267DD0E|nr:flagellar hook assembly protein FlgD [Roseivivax sp. THAF40]QFT47400.1 Basal-body rod modification protein FlgD [Roseivivax sp. THAF40]